MVQNSKDPETSPTRTSGQLAPDEKQARRQHKEQLRKLRADTPITDHESHSPKVEETSPASTSLALIPVALDTYRRDVFGAYPVELRGTALEALDEQIDTISKQELVLEFCVGTQHPLLTTVFKASLQDVGLFTCFLAAAQCFYERRRSPDNFQPSDELVRTQSRGLKNICDRIMQPNAEDDEELLAAILQLMVVDAVAGNIPSLISHQRGVRKMLSLRGTVGHSALNRSTMGLLMVIEFYVVLGQFFSPNPSSPAPTENALRYMKHPFPPSMCSRLAKLPPGLENVVLSGKVSLQTIKLLESVADWSSLIEIEDVSMRSEASKESYGRLFAEPMDCCRSAVFVLRHLKSSNSQFSIEYTLCLGIVIVIKHTRRKTDEQNGQLLRTFVESVQRCIHPDSIEFEIIIWLAAAVAWRTMDELRTQTEEFMDFVIRTYEDTRDLKSVQATWGKFLWYQKFGSVWSDIWQEAIDRREARITEKSASADQKEPSPGTAQQGQQPRRISEIKKEESGDSLQSLGSSSLAWSTSTPDDVEVYSDTN